MNMTSNRRKASCKYDLQNYYRENHMQESEISEDLAALRCGHLCASVVKCFGLFLRNAHYHNDIESGTSGNRSRRGKHYKRYFFSQLRVLLKGYLWEGPVEREHFGKDLFVVLHQLWLLK